MYKKFLSDATPGERRRGEEGNVAFWRVGGCYVENAW